MVADFAKLAATLYTNITTPVQYAAFTAYSPNPVIESYFKVTRDIHRMMGEYFAQAFSSIDGISTSTPRGAFYFSIDLNSLKPDLEKKGIVSSNKLQHAMIAHPWHIATVTGDAIMMPQDNFSARIAFVDYDGGRALGLYDRERPRTREEECTLFVETAAPRMVEGVAAVREFVESL